MPIDGKRCPELIYATHHKKCLLVGNSILDWILGKDVPINIQIKQINFFLDTKRILVSIEEGYVYSSKKVRGIERESLYEFCIMEM